MVNDFLPSLDAYSCSLLINTRTARKAISWNSYCMLSSLLQSKPLWDSWFQSSNVSVPRHLVRSTGAGRVRPTDARRARSLVLFVQTVCGTGRRSSSRRLQCLGGVCASKGGVPVRII